MTTLEKIIGSSSRLKVVRFFLQNPNRIVTAKELVKILKISSSAASRDIAYAKSIELVIQGVRIDIVEHRGRSKKKKVLGFLLSQDFVFFQPLFNLVIAASPVSRESIIKFFKSKKNTQLVALGGIFVQDAATPKSTILNTGAAEKNQSLDLLIVANKMKKNDVDNFIKKIELEIGKELLWVLLSESEFKYRRGMHDKFLRDLFDYPHELLINKLGVE